ncbi:MAG: flagellar hook-associated protein 3 [Treponema sp.]|nr:flagellar hook-associated protein 3 [Treponema sp.]
MARVSTNMANTNVQFHLRRQEDAILNLQNQMSSGNRLNRLSDDPIAAARTVRYQSYLTRLERFENNTRYARDHFNQIDINLQESVNILQRIRELAVTGATGTFARDDTRHMAVEVNELMKALVAIANSTGPDGRQLFAGDRVFTEPFRIVEGTVDGGGESLVVNVEYRGAGPARRTEIHERTFIDLDLGGGHAFWAERMQIFSGVDASNWRALENGAFFINGHEILVRAGDTLPAVVASINESGAAVRASVDPSTNGLVITGTNPHLIRMEDRQGSNTLEELGVVRFNTDPSAPNWDPGARVAGGSVFDMVIRLRDGLLRGDHEFVGGLGISGIDLSLQNMTARLAEVGSRHERASVTWSRINQEIPNVAAMLARESGVDLATAATDFAMMELAQRAALQTAARIIPPTLLDFLR